MWNRLTTATEAEDGADAAGPADDVPVVVLAGPARLAEQVFLALSKMPLEVRQTRTLPAGDGSGGEPAAVIAAVPDLSSWQRRRLAHVAARCTDEGIPLIVAARRLGDRRHVRRLCRSGVSEVVRWPRERGALLDALRPITPDA